MALLGFHLHSAPGDITASAMMVWLQLMGGTAARLDTNWSDYQAPPQPASFSPAAPALPDNRFRDYLRRRGYGTGGQNLRPPLDDLRAASAHGIRAVFNFGVVRDWAMKPREAFPATTAGQRQWETSIADPALPGEFLHDFIAYVARQKGGTAALENLTGWQMFNEVNGIYGERIEQLPRDDYFALGEKTLALVHGAYEAVSWSKIAKRPPPPVILPSLGGAHNPIFFDALIDYAVKDKSVANADGSLAIEAVAIHPYGQRIEPWLDPVTDEELGDATKDTLIYHRILRPTDDRLTWHALLGRKASEGLNLSLYSGRANPAEGYFDRNTEQGTEQTMAQLAQNGYGGLHVHFTEWGHTTYRGNAATGEESLWDTAFADPAKYGVFKAGSILPRQVAENLQAETILQTVGLIESWDFVDTATVYEMFDQKQGDYEGEFGLARGIKGGQPDWKPAGRAYKAYLSGAEFHLRDICGKEGNTGVDLHIAARGVSGSFDNNKRDPSAHELVLLREGPDSFDGGAGDDVVFGGAGDDTLEGGIGYDRLYGGEGNDVISGGEGADKIKGDAGDDTLSGGEGADHFVFAAYGKTGSGFAGKDTIADFNPAEDKLLITGGYRVQDLLNDKLFPQLVQDTPLGLRLTYADNGATITLKGVTRAQLSPVNFHMLQSDRTIAFAVPPAQIVMGGPGADELQGTSRDDLISGGRGADHMSGGNGNDSYQVDNTEDAVHETEGEGEDRIVSRVSFILPDNVENLLLDSWKPIDGTGNALANEIAGNANRNVLQGEGGDDLLSGGPGRDTLDGGPGNDELWGGSGNDAFAVGTGAGADVIMDFTLGDTLQFSPSDGFATPRDVISSAVSENGGLVIPLPSGGKLTLRGVQPGDLAEDAIIIR